eukprot:2472800-Rhodomonas_salina.3
MNWEREASSVVGNAKQLAEAVQKLQSEPNLDRVEGQPLKCSEWFWRIARPYVRPSDRDATKRAHSMGRMTNWFERLDIDHPTLLLIEEWLLFAQSLQASPLLTQLRSQVVAVKLAWIPSPIYSGCAVNPASLPCPEAYRSFDLRNVWGSPAMWSR